MWSGATGRRTPLASRRCSRLAGTCSAIAYSGPPGAGTTTRSRRTMAEMTLRPATADDRHDVADLICVSTNYWYRASGRPAIFCNGPSSTTLFFDVYEALDPGCCVVAEDRATGHLMGSCFYHPRDTH